MIDCTHEEELLLTILLGVYAKRSNGKDSHFCTVGQSFPMQNRDKTAFENTQQ
ncbi:hypothetical protein HMPREF0971_00026 [Segatella oris F0302]|uniref:Uncharacterized protein n=1 Tax=Segatella oris F0302 TaxID=649760 RepID=D1QM44_9BACT|nr:hypothetical protein HMPREF0971_00026 [Segatella oris F0302]